MDAHLLVVKLTGSDKSIRAFLSAHPAEPSRVVKKGDLVSVQIEMSSDLRKELEKRRIEYAIVEDITKTGPSRVAEVGRQRFRPGHPPTGFGKLVRD